MAETSRQSAAREGENPGQHPAGSHAEAPTRAPIPDVPHALLLPQGHEVEEFRIEGALGVGGFAITYLALDQRLQRRVALKEFMPENLVARRDPESQRPVFRSLGDRARFESFLERFRDEALDIARFNHPNIIAIHRVLPRNGTAYIVMEHVGETSLARLVAAGKRLGEAELAHLLGGALDGLSEMHAAGLLHRDLKPSNIMLRADGTPVLIDFGSVRRAHCEGEPAAVRVVSESFSPPEQHDADGQTGPWSDIFALAATCYYAMRGEPPGPVVDRVLALMRRKPDPLVPLNTATTGGLYSEPFLAAVGCALELRERARPQSVPEWAAMFPAPLCRRHFPAPNFANAEAEADGDAAPSIAGALRPSATPPADAALPALRALYRRERRDDRAPPRRSESRRRVLRHLPGLAVLLIGASVAVGVATQQIGRPAETAELAEITPAAAPEPAVTPLAARAAPAPPSGAPARCDALAAHPDDPGRPRGTAGVAFDAITEAAAREAVAICAKALREEPGNLRAQFNLGRAHQRLARLKPAENAEALRRAGEAYAAAASGGYAAAQGNFGQMLYGGTGGVGVDLRQAVEWLRKSAAGNFPDAYLTLAFAYSTGRGVDRPDPRKAFCWLTLVERSSSVQAYRALAQQQRAALAVPVAEKRVIEDSAKQGASCL